MNIIDIFRRKPAEPTEPTQASFMADPVSDDPQYGPWRSLGTNGTARSWSDIQAQLQAIHRAVNGNPLAARLIRMTGDFVLGTGATLHGGTHAQRLWSHPLNMMQLRLFNWCSELATSGELFLLCSVNKTDHMVYFRELPALLIDEIDHPANDIEQATRFHMLTDDSEGQWFPAYSVGITEPFVLHFTINRPTGDPRGMSDLAQILPWLERYDLWLEDRVRINRYRGAHLWHVQITGMTEVQLAQKRAQYAKPPRSGSVIVTSEQEKWTAIQPNINADDVEADGKAIRLMIAAGSGVPLHFLAEGESATRATAREMGTAVYRHFAHRQLVMKTITTTALRIALQVARVTDDTLDVEFPSVLTEDRRIAESNNTPADAQPAEEPSI